jgi:hypothetical protein
VAKLPQDMQPDANGTFVSMKGDKLTVTFVNGTPANKNIAVWAGLSNYVLHQF